MIEKQFNELLEFAKTTDLVEVVWEKNGSAISFHRTVQPPSPAKPAAAPATQPAGRLGQPAAAAKESGPEPVVIRSTMVGTFFRSDSPDRPPFVVEGTLVTAGQAVGAIEAMKIMKDVVAPNACRIVKALVANGHPVEYGQPLFEVESGADEAHV